MKKITVNKLSGYNNGKILIVGRNSQHPTETLLNKREVTIDCVILANYWWRTESLTVQNRSSDAIRRQNYSIAFSISIYNLRVKPWLVSARVNVASSQNWNQRCQPKEQIVKGLSCGRGNHGVYVMLYSYDGCFILRHFIDSFTYCRIERD